MREGGNNGNQLLLPTPKEEMPAPPQPAALSNSSASGMMPMQPMPANVMSPDDMLRAYAESRRTPVSPAFPSPALTNYDGNGMRTLYSTPATPSLTTFASASEDPDSYRKSTAASMTSKYDDEDAYVGTAN